jgi:serine/threonine protein kinase
MPFASGTRFGAFEIIEWLGAGGMGEVYRARETRLDRTVALKVIRRQNCLDTIASSALNVKRVRSRASIIRTFARSMTSASRTGSISGHRVRAG